MFIVNYMYKQRIMLIFGGNGFVGSYICREALANNYKVVIACRSPSPFKQETTTDIKLPEHSSNKLNQQEKIHPVSDSLHNKLVLDDEMFEKSNANFRKIIENLPDDIPINSDTIEWRQCNCLHRKDVDAVLTTVNPHIVVSTIGYLKFDYHEARKLNQEPNMTIIRALNQMNFDIRTNGDYSQLYRYAHRATATSNFEKFVYVSAAQIFPYNEGGKYILRGYYEGKRTVELTMHEYLSGDKNTADKDPVNNDSKMENYAILRPGMIYGSRQINLHRQLPLQLIGVPLEALFKWLFYYFQWYLLTPPIDAKALAKAVVNISNGKESKRSKATNDSANCKYQSDTIINNIKKTMQSNNYFDYFDIINTSNL